MYWGAIAHLCYDAMSQPPVIGMSLKLFHLGAENWTQKVLLFLSVSDTVVITASHTVL